MHDSWRSWNVKLQFKERKKWLRKRVWITDLPKASRVRKLPLLAAVSVCVRLSHTGWGEDTAGRCRGTFSAVLGQLPMTNEEAG